MYDYVIVGSGLFGSVFAERAKKNGKKCLIVEKRNHIGGNCFTENINGINVHKYGIHVFHTSSETIWNYINTFSKFNHFVNRPKVSYGNKIYSFPINLMTLNQLWGINTPSEAIKKINEVKINIKNPCNLEEWALSQIGEELYNIFIYGYTKKQWKREPSQLPSFIIKRIPIRLTWDDNYYEDCYQGIPIDGYTKIFEKMLDGIEIKTEVDFFSDKELLKRISKKIVYSGKIDEYFDYKYGELEYRSLRFENELLETNDYQGNAQINYTDENVPFTRLIEHKHFEFKKTSNTIITKEYPIDWNRNEIPYYPINDEKNNSIYELYNTLKINESNVIFGGRLSSYKYYDMHQVIAESLNLWKKEKR